jgi:hypothetical protein
LKKTTIEPHGSIICLNVKQKANVQKNSVLNGQFEEEVLAICMEEQLMDLKPHRVENYPDRLFLNMADVP